MERKALKELVLKKLCEIKELAESTGCKGQLELSFNCGWKEFDSMLNSLNEFPKHKHNVEVVEGLNVFLLCS